MYLFATLLLSTSPLWGMDVGIIGDSNSNPYFVKEDELYYRVAEKNLCDLVMHNSVCPIGAKTDTLFQRAKDLLEQHPSIECMIICLGVNDAAAFVETNIILYNFSQTIEYLQERGIDVILGTVDVSFYAWPYERLYMRKFVEMYHILEKIYGVTTFPFISWHIINGKHIGDCVHPNVNGHKVIGSILETELRKKSVCR